MASLPTFNGVRAEPRGPWEPFGQACAPSKVLVTSPGPEPKQEPVACGCPTPLQGTQDPSWCMPSFLQAQSRRCCREAVEQQGSD